MNINSQVYRKVYFEFMEREYDDKSLETVFLSDLLPERKNTVDSDSFLLSDRNQLEEERI